MTNSDERVALILKQDLLYISPCFVDYPKSFDSVDHNKLWSVLKETGVPQHLIFLMCNLYCGQKASVRTEYGETEWFLTGKGIRQ